MNKSKLLVVVPALFLSACYSFQGPERLVERDLQPADFGQSTDISLFVEDFGRALSYRKEYPSEDNPHVKPLLRSGFMYNRSFCINWFNQMVQNQRRSQIVRGAIPPITTLLTGLIGLGDFSDNPGQKEDLVELLAIGSAATTATLNIYDRHFLFGAENFGAVKAMTLKGQKAHADKALSQTGVTFEQAMEHLVDNQDQCAPDNIMTLARDVMQNAPLEARTQNPSGERVQDDSAGTVEVGPRGG